MNFGALKRTPALIAAGIIALFCIFQLASHDFLERMERMTYDWRVREALLFSPVTVTNLGFVNIGDDAIRLVNQGLVGQRPYGLAWPRHIYGRMLNELENQGAQAVAFDVLFSELRPDQDPLWIDNAEVESDKFLADELKKSGNVILAAEPDTVPATLFRSSALAIGDIKADTDGDGILRRTAAFRVYRKWHRVFQQIAETPKYGVDPDLARIETNHLVFPRAKPFEDLVVPLDKDGNFDVLQFVNKLPPGMPRFDAPFRPERVWNMGIVLAAQALKLDLDNARVQLNQGRIILHGANGVERIIPVDSDGYFFIDWTLPVRDKYKRLTVEHIEGLLAQYEARVLQESNDIVATEADFWKAAHVNWRGKLVVVGSTATGHNLTDLGATPLEQNTYLMSEHWNVANSVLSGRFIHRSSAAAAFFFIALLGALSAYFTRGSRFHSYVGSTCVVLSAFVYIVITVFAYVMFRYWMPIVLPVACSLVVHSALLGHLVFFEQRERRRIRNVFSKVVSRHIVEELLQAPNLSVDGAQRSVTVFFSDIRGFTEMTDLNRDRAEDYIKEHNLIGTDAEKVRNLEARETLDTVNLYLKVIANVVLKHGGTVDKFIGDCVMAFWGAPVPNSHHALHCVRAAVETQRAVFNLNQERETENRQREGQNLMLAAEGKQLLSLLPLLVVGTGINTGVATVGLMGSDEQANYTVFGREVNLASRLETISGRCRIIISEATLAEIIQDDSTLALSCKPLPPEKVKGIRQPVQIYEVPWREGESANARIPEAPASESFNTGYFTASDSKD